jgi:protein-disulfide isomerase
MHPNACWAARTAEAASILGGNDGFWRMHAWLFAERGSFTDASFPVSLRELGFDPSSFIPIMTSQETLDTVRTDTDAAKELGVFFTPMIFINGVEYTWYYGGKGSLAETIELAARSDSPVVAPPDARERLFEDWRIGRTRAMPGTRSSSWLGEGAVEVVVYGDYQSDASKSLDLVVRALQEKGNPIRYTWRHYPLETAANSSQSHAGSEAMARAVEAAGNIAGDDARWSTHAWLIESAPPTTEDQLARALAGRIGVDEATVLAEMKSPKVSSRLARDMADKYATWSKHLPVIVIDDRLVPRWSSDEVPAEELLSRIISSARRESTAVGGN